MLDPHFFSLISHDIQNSIQSLIHTFIPMGKNIAAVVLLLQMTYRIALYLLSPESDSLLTLIWQPIFRYAFLIFMLTHWSEIAHFFFSSVRECAQLILSQTDSNQVLATLHHQIEQILHRNTAHLTEHLEGLAVLTRLLEAKLMTGITILLMIVVMILYLFILNIGLILLGIGLILGPLILPFYQFTLTDFLLDGWLRFMLSAALYQLVGSTTVVILHTIMKHLHLLSQAMVYNANIPIDYDLSILTLTIILCLMAVLIMLQTPSIAASLVSGARILHNMRPALPKMPSPQQILYQIKQSQLSREIREAERQQTPKDR